MSGLVKWRTKPIVTITRDFRQVFVDWTASQASQSFEMGNEIEIQVRYQWKKPYNECVKFNTLVEYSNDGGSTWTTVVDEEYKDMSVHNEEDGHTGKYRFELLDNLVMFRVCVSSWKDRNNAMTDPHGHDNDNSPGITPNYYLFWAYVNYLGAFSLSHLPITLLYCPPGQDMYNALKQTEIYGTVISHGFNVAVGTRSGEEMKIKGGGSVGIGKHIEGVGGGEGSVGGGLSKTYTTEERETIESYMENKISFSYEWNTTLIADTQNVIGRRYFGPLGDIFLILKEPWFAVFQDDLGFFQLGAASELTGSRTEIIAIPVHKLLRPGNDPIANNIPEEIRERILKLDPFIVNLHKFFPEDEADPSTPLEEAVDPALDPSAGNLILQNGENRTALIARYSISSGVELDLSQITAISFSNKNTNSTTFYSEVSETDGLSAFADTSGGYKLFKGASNLGVDKTSYTGDFVEISYQNSIESTVSRIKTAICKLVRNQNTTDLRDIEVHWDKQFSTFLFSMKSPNLGTITGTIYQGTIESPFTMRAINMIITAVNISSFVDSNPDIFKATTGIDPHTDPPKIVNELMRNDSINFDNVAGKITPNIIYKTTTDDIGHYTIRNLEPGIYLIVAGDKNAKLNLTEKDLGRTKTLNFKNVKRHFDFRKSALWELQEILDIPLSTAKRIKLASQQAKDLDRDTWANILSKEKLSIDAFEKRAFTNYGVINVNTGSVLIEGWITNPIREPVKACSILIIESKILKEKCPEFFKKRKISFEMIIKKIPKTLFYRARSNPLGYYTIKNIPPGNYQIVVGDTRTAINIPKKDVQKGFYKKLDIKNVKPSFSPKSASFWEIKNIFDTSLTTAMKLELKFKKAKSLDAISFKKIISEEDLSLKTVNSQAIIMVAGSTSKEHTSN